MIGPDVNLWQIACPSRALRARPVSRLLSGRPVVLYRDATGRAHALQDRCAHRRAPLSAGRVRAEGLECPYHGWVYDGDGHLVRVPALPAACDARDRAACEAAAIRVPAFAVRERQGYVWVASRPGDAPDVEPLPFPHLGEAGWTSFRMRTRFDADVSTCLENFLDCPHATFVHRYWFRAPLARAVGAVISRTDDGVQVSFTEEPREKSLVWWLLAPRGGEMTHTDRFVAPARSQVDYGFPNGWRYSITSSCTEIDEQRTEVHTVMSFRTAGVGPLIRLYFEPLSRLIIRQDARIIALRARNIERFDDAGDDDATETSTQADLLGPLVRRWRADLAAARAPGQGVAGRAIRIHL
ncbi:MAG: Rieske 2Fe-2S domain-containing protein [Lautropia sp.]